MNERWNWEDLRLFLGVARGGGLAKAVGATQVSAPTLSRRMYSLERTLSVTLFDRSRDGYELTSDGVELLRLAEAVERDAFQIDRWTSNVDRAPRVKIAAGAWTSLFIARHIKDLLGGDDDIAIDIIAGTSQADLLRREANLGIRNRRPEITGLAGQRLVQVEFAVYGSDAFCKTFPQAGDDRRFSECDWIAFAPRGPVLPSAAWLSDVLLQRPRFVCSSPNAVLEAALAGAGLCILPCFIGDAEARLRRQSGVLDSLRHDQWLVSHDDDRRDRHVSTVSKKIAKLMRGNRDLFAGKLMN